MATDLHRHVTGERAINRDTLLKVAQEDPDWEPMRRKTLADGCSTALVAALVPDLEPNGAYLCDCQLWRAKATTRDVKAAQKVWQLSERLIGHKFGEAAL